MKELSIEQKSVRYDEIIKKANKMHNENCEACQICIEELIPKLAESEDERIRKVIADIVKAQPSDSLFNGTKEKCLAWLEKQGQDGKVWFYRDDYVREKKQAYQDGIDNVLNSPQKYGLEKQGEQKPMNEKSLYKAGYLDGFEDGVRDAIIKEDEQKPAWSEEDESKLKSILFHIEDVENKDVIDWLNSLKDRVQPKQEWKQENTHDLTDFENVMMHIGDSFFGENAGLDPNDTIAIKEQANILLGLIPKQDWSEEDEKMLKDTICFCELCGNQVSANWLKSLRPQNRWKPSVFHLECIEDAISLYETRSINAIGLKEILDELKKLKG